MNRALFYNKTTVDGIEELDVLDNSLGEFKISYPVQYYRVNAEDIVAPDLISIKLYKTELYWWIIMLVNGIVDVFSDLYVGQLLVIPNILDIRNFSKTYKMR